MRRFFLVILLIGIAFIFGSTKKRAKAISTLFQSSQEEKRLEPSPYPLENRRFCIAILGKNNGAYLEKILRTVFFQNYENFHVVYIDNASEDGSFELAKELVENGSLSKKIDLLQNEQPLGKAQSLLRALQFCEEGEIIVFLPGDDWLAHEWVLQRLNQYYADPDLWVVCARSCDYPTFDLGAIFSLAREEGKVLAASPHIAFLQTFYAELLNGVEAEDPFYSILSIAQGHIQFAPEVLYIVNKERFE